MGYLLPLLIGLISSTLLPVNSENASKTHPHSNETDVTDVVSTRNRLGFLSGLGGGQGLMGSLGSLGGLGGLGGGSSQSTSSGSAPGGTSISMSMQQGLKGIQAIQKFMQRFQSTFSFRGVSDTMATITGLLAAVGGGYLTYVSMVSMFGSMMDPHNTAYQHAYSAPPHHYVPNPSGGGAQIPAGYNRRQSTDGSSNFYFGSLDLGKLLHSVTHYNYPEASFKLLRIKDETCKQRAVCEFEKFLARKGVASVILKGVSKKITGMEKYLDAAYRGLANEDCGYAFSSCPYTLGQTMLRSVGLS